jgi:hypothetical protein
MVQGSKESWMAEFSRSKGAIFARRFGWQIHGFQYQEE